MQKRTEIQEWIQSIPQTGKSKFWDILAGNDLQDLLCDYMLAAYAYLKETKGAVTVDDYKNLVNMNFHYMYECGVQEYVKVRCAELKINNVSNIPLYLCSEMKHLSLSDAALLANIWRCTTMAGSQEELLNILEAALWDLYHD